MNATQLRFDFNAACYAGDLAGAQDYWDTLASRGVDMSAQSLASLAVSLWRQDKHLAVVRWLMARIAEKHPKQLVELASVGGRARDLAHAWARGGLLGDLVERFVAACLGGDLEQVCALYLELRPPADKLQEIALVMWERGKFSHPRVLNQLVDWIAQLAPAALVIAADEDFRALAACWARNGFSTRIERFENACAAGDLKAATALYAEAPGQFSVDALEANIRLDFNEEVGEDVPAHPALASWLLDTIAARDPKRPTIIASRTGFEQIVKAWANGELRD